MADNWVYSIFAECVRYATPIKVNVQNGKVIFIYGNPHVSAISIEARVTDALHPETVFVAHGFGHRLPVEIRAFSRARGSSATMVRIAGTDKNSGGLFRTARQIFILSYGPLIHLSTITRSR